ncbi:hypothetical protein HELRODRAFT_182959 [Helobdella robusta]|uniref:C-type lectin domain-containing protein n=1 Tax=Helobdella robusta TaxID=6412 RepID=T1FIZ8_HELRO|nr:hypothetical protein HELRODRAFT_182959 [Helobdella robusta]ESN89949.1 hypothetical protein HELRODRAFT_182959 [Helobdella robusta]
MGEIQTVFQASLLLVGLFGCTGEGACPDPFTLIGGRCIYVNRTGASWDASVIAYYCENHFWTAGRKKNNSQVFEWKIFRTAKFLDEILQYKSAAEISNWRSGEPNNKGGNEDFLELHNHISEKFEFNDVPGNFDRCPICQFDG